MQPDAIDFNKYIGLQYKAKGRDTAGIDCYGLARLVYSQEFGIELPSFDSDYQADDEQRMQDLIAQYKEGWVKVDKPEPGSIVLFKVMGYETHIGIAVNSESFLHVREGMDSVIEPFSTPRWNKRIVGHFKYLDGASEVATLNAVPHPLKTERYTMPVPAGYTVARVVESINQKFDVSSEYAPKLTVMLNGKVVPEADWDKVVIKHNDAIEYRTVPGKAVARTLAVLALAVVAPYLGGLAEFAYLGTAGASLGGAAAVFYGTQAAVFIGGMALIDKIAPIRPPSSPSDPGSSERQLMVNGGSNQANRYGAKPVVLGKVRVFPLLGAQNYLTYESERDSYLSMLLEWGFGPLEIDKTTFKFGEVPISNFTDFTEITLDRKTEPTAQELLDFNAIYGKDIDQKNLQQEIVCDGNPEAVVTPGPWIEATTTQQVDSVTVAIHFPQGLRKVKAQGDNAGSSYGTNVNLRLEKSTDGVTWTALDSFDASNPVSRTVKQSSWGVVAQPGNDDYPFAWQQIETDVVITESLVKKDAFTTTKTYSAVGTDDLKFIRVRRETGDNVEDNPDWRYYHQSILQSVTFTSNQHPAIDPPNCKIAKTAIKIKATDQLNGNLEGLNAIVQTIAPTWNGSAWVDAPTSNPASLMIYVLMHPANPRRKTWNQINQPEMQYFYNYCQTKGFEYNSILGQQRSVLEVMRDICAAGRASPNLKDGKWTVTIDEPKAIVQHFTPHNSWGFEGVKNLPELPHGLRIKYFDQDSSYQESEIIVYNNGYSEANASLFEAITLPGVTKKSLVIDHARWHMAQAKLRPEVYTLSTDFEGLVCNRGDRVKVMHDVPMWGLSSGRIKNKITDQVFELDELIPMEEGKSYTIRVRANDGSSHVQNVVPYGLTYGSTSTSLFVDDDLEVSLEDGSTFLWMLASKGTGTNPVVTANALLNPKTTATDVDRVVFNRGAGNTADDQSNLYAFLPETDSAYAVSFWAKSADANTYTAKVELNKYGTGPSTIITISPEWKRFALYVGPGAARIWKTLRIRLDGSTSATADIHIWQPQWQEGIELPPNLQGNVTALTDGWFDMVKTVNPIAQANPGDLFLFGENQQEAQDLTVISIEPAENMSMRMTLVDYGVTDTYNIFTDYLDLSEDVVFESQITLPPNLQINAFGLKKPTITAFVSDESVMDIISKGVFQYNMQVSFTNAASLPAQTAVVEAEYDLAAAIDSTNIRYARTEYQRGSVSIKDVIEGEQYKVRLRYIDSNGRVGLWSDYATHFVVGKSSQPAGVTGFNAVAENSLGKVRLQWELNKEPDIKGYEVRTDTNFGQTTGLIAAGEETTCFADAPIAPGQQKTYYIAAYDYSGNYSSTVAQTTYTYPAINEVQGVNWNFADDALTSATITLNWLVPDNAFAVDYYEVTYNGTIKEVKANTITLPANWLGDRLYTIKVVDILGNKSTGVQNYITKLAPNPPSNYRSQVIDNNVMLYWTLPEKTTLPIDHVSLKKGSTWETATDIGEKKGEFTTVLELQSGEFTYWIATVDTDGNASEPISITTQVSEPPDFEFFGDFQSTFTGTLSNALKEAGGVVMPLNVTETWGEHFSTRTWDSPEDQITAGYPIYAQPTVTTGYYEEVFDYGTILASSKITLNFNGLNFGGTPLISSSLAVSTDGVNYVTYQGVVSVFVTNFRFVKVRITASNTNDKAMYKLNFLEVRLDAKKKYDSLSVTALSTDSLGTIVNFNKEFIDVQSINVTANATSALIAVYDFQDAVLSATYSITSNVCTVSYPDHGFIAGQKLRLGIGSGLGITGVYTVVTAATNSFTVAMTAADTTGSVLVYPQSARVYVFDQASGSGGGNNTHRVTAVVSIEVSGY